MFLEDIKETFFGKYNEAMRNSAIAYSMNSFGDLLATKMNYYSNDPDVDKIKKLKRNLDDFKDVMVKNIGLISILKLR